MHDHPDGRERGRGAPREHARARGDISPLACPRRIDADGDISERTYENADGDSAVGILAVSDRSHLNDLRAIVEVIDDSIITDAHAPEICGAAQLLAAWRTRRRRQRIELPRDASEHGVGKCLELLSRRSDETELVHARSAGLALLGFEPTSALETPTDGGPGFGPLILTRAGQCHVEQIFPDVAVVLEIDQDRGLLAARVVEVLHTTHVETP